MSVFSIKTWITKGYSEEEAKYQVSIRRPSNILYYINKGMNQDEAKKALNEFSKRGAKKWVESTTAEERKKSRSTCLEYYLERGLSEEDAEIARSERQKTFTKEKCIEKLGEDEGTKVWKQRQEKWQAAINSKSVEELADINSRKNSWKDLDDAELERRKAATSEKVQKFWNNSTTEYRINHGKRIREFWDNSTIEYRITHGKRIRESFVKIGRAVPIDELDTRHQYYLLVDRYTRCQPIDALENFDLRAIKNFHLDHKYSKIEGYKNNIDPSIIGHICNLEMISWQENTSKHSKCSITLETLLENIERYNDNSQKNHGA